MKNILTFQQGYARPLCLCLFFLLVGSLSAAELETTDFVFNGEFGCEGATIKKVKKNYFRVTLSSAPEHPTWPNMLQFQIAQHALGNKLVLEVSAPGINYAFDEYFQSWSYDKTNWTPIFWRNNKAFLDVLTFPVFTQDTVYCGHQMAFSNEDIETMVSSWSANPYVKLTEIGSSYQGRNIYRLEITDPESPYPRRERWVNEIMNPHPGENNARWRIVGMIEWLLSDDPKARDYRKRGITHFVLTMCPDGVANGYYRVNTKGVDMNRSYFVTGSDPVKQTKEAYLCQKDLELLMASEEPVSCLWTMHTDVNQVSVLITTGTEMGAVSGPWTELKEAIIKNDSNHLISDPQLETASRTGTFWDNSPAGQFPSMSTVLVEGGGGLTTISLNKESGVVLMKAIVDYYKSPKPLLK